jgi:hypothetical protein
MRENSTMASTRHIPYEQKSGRKCDFVVSYDLQLDPRLAGVEALRQGQRTDFCYEADYTGNMGMSVFMIWPEFLGPSGAVIEDTGVKIPESGFANMWIMTPELRATHKQRLKIGTVGYMVVGPYRIARVVVQDLSGLRLDK